MVRPLVDCSVRVGDVVPHETPNISVVRKMVRHLKSGGTLPPIHVDLEWKEHWTQGPKGMDSIGVGYGLLDGHHRLAACIECFGADYQIAAISYAPVQQPEATRPRMRA